jgi:HK97 family phage major capsid protein
MWSRLWARGEQAAIWTINRDVLPQLFTMTIGTGATSQPVYMPPTRASGQPYGTIFGRPVISMEQCSTLGTVGDIMLLDLSQYILADKGGINAAQSIHVRFIYDEMTFRFTYRVDGQPAWPQALTPASGSANTLSPFVALQTR